MSRFHNVMEVIVTKKLDEVWANLDCCKCENCHDDIIALALNHLPSKYVVTTEGELYARMSELSAEKEFYILLEVARAIEIVSKNPRHDDNKLIMY